MNDGWFAFNMRFSGKCSCCGKALFPTDSCWANSTMLPKWTFRCYGCGIPTHTPIVGTIAKTAVAVKEESGKEFFDALESMAAKDKRETYRDALKVMGTGTGPELLKNLVNHVDRLKSIEGYADAVNRYDMTETIPPPVEKTGLQLLKENAKWSLA